MNLGTDYATITQVKKNTVWYMPGAGGNWLNYMLWCYLHNRTIPGNHKNFHINTLTEFCPEYHYILGVSPHQVPWQACNVLFGSHKSALNIFITNCRKLGYNPDTVVHMALLYQKTYDWSVEYNIQWHLLPTDPEAMLKLLSDILGIEISYTTAVQHAFQQYINSCWPPELQGDAWLDHPLTNAYIQALDMQGLPKETVFNHWTKYSPR